MTETVQQALDELTRLHPKKIDLGLERIERVLKALGDPHLLLPPTVHIAGTNGKGSTTAFLRAMAEAQGLKAHVYTSPHLVRFSERIIVGSEQIDDRVLVNVLTRVREANAGAPLSFFEATTAAAFLAFSEAPADMCILEVGLGGRYDATNVIDMPAVAALTPIALDHAEFLGRDIAAIAREKSGIFKFNGVAFAGPQTDLVDAVIEAEANKMNIQLSQWGREFRAYKQQGGLVFETENEVMDLPKPGLIGDHQYMNAGLAVALARHMQISREAIARGMESVKWPARMQNLTSGPLAEKISAIGGELWLDGGHNPHAASAIAAVVADLETRVPRPLVLITGMLANKDVGGFLDKYAGLAAHIIAVDIPGHASLAAETLAELASSRGISSYMADDIGTAIDLAAKMKDGDLAPRILICGSLYLSGEVLKENG
ncbi:MAG: bifunctional folylpolyglutamate synthase/dihydrofolate synthase [Hellea sp.]|nr:bifunctional folylpolyglutamate synthase/dihydrofolate synthase [Hellea sp.]